MHIECHGMSARMPSCLPVATSELPRRTITKSISLFLQYLLQCKSLTTDRVYAVLFRGSIPADRVPELVQGGLAEHSEGRRFFAYCLTMR